MSADPSEDPPGESPGAEAASSGPARRLRDRFEQGAADSSAGFDARGGVVAAIDPHLAVDPMAPARALRARIPTAVEPRVTVGEIADAMREGSGEYDNFSR
jgi:hypothetical protein